MMRFIKVCIPVLLLLLIANAVSAKDIPVVPFTKAIKDKRIKITNVVSNGGAITNGLTITIENLTKDEVRLKMDPALLFRSENEKYQDLVAVGEESLSIKGKSKANQKLRTFCGNAKALTPIKGLKYKFTGKGDEAFAKTTQYIKKEKVNNHLAQLAVWTFTNNHCLSTVFVPGYNEAKMVQLIKFIADATQQPVPDYYTYHKFTEKNSQPGEVMFDNNVTFLQTYVEWNVGERHRNVRIKILDKDRMFYKNIRNNIVGRSNGIERMYVTFDPAEDMPGEYYIQVIDDDNYLWTEKKINLWVYNCVRK